MQIALPFTVAMEGYLACRDDGAGKSAVMKGAGSTATFYAYDNVGIIASGTNLFCSGVLVSQ
jgi:hypothetical protein